MTTSLLNHRPCAVFSLALFLVGTALVAQSSAWGVPLLVSGSKTATSGSVSDEYSDSNYAESIGSAATATFGVLHASSFSISTVDAFAPASLINASFRDDWLIDAAGLTNTAGKVIVKFTIDGSLTSTSSGTPTYNYQANSTYAQASYIFGAYNPTSLTKSERHYGDGRITGQTFLGVEQTFELDFTFGQTLPDVKLQITTTASSAGGYGYSSSSAADLSHTAVWGGFVEVRDSGGNVVSNYSFSSASGTNFVQAIPEPGTCALLVLSGMAFNFLRPRRRKSMLES